MAGIVLIVLLRLVLEEISGVRGGVGEGGEVKTSGSSEGTEGGGVPGVRTASRADLVPQLARER